MTTDESKIIIEDLIDEDYTPALLTLTDIRRMDKYITGADLTRDQMTALSKEAYSKLHATGALEKDLSALKDKYIRKHNSTGISPENRKFRTIWDYSSRDQICRYAWGSKREKLLALWDERERCRYEDEYTRYLDTLIETAGNLCTDDLALYNVLKAEYDKKMMADYKAEMEARKAASKVC